MTVTDGQVTLHFASGKAATPAVTLAAPSSVFHLLFAEDDASWHAAATVAVDATIDARAVTAVAKTLAYDEVLGGQMDSAPLRYATRVIYALTGAPPTDASTLSALASSLNTTNAALRTTTLANFVLQKLLDATEVRSITNWTIQFWGGADASAAAQLLVTGKGVNPPREMRDNLSLVLQDPKTLAAAGDTSSQTQAASYAQWLDYIFTQALGRGPTTTEVANIAAIAGPTPTPYAAAAAFPQLLVYAETVEADSISAYWRQAATQASVDADPALSALLCPGAVAGCDAATRYLGTNPLLLSNLLAADRFFNLSP